jgi:polygalacturonase
MALQAHSLNEETDVRTRNHRSRTATILMPLALLLLSPAAGADVLFVDPAVNDGNPGSEGRPWRTIQKAASDAKPGDRVIVRKGTYTERVRFNVSGQSGRPIAFEALGEVVVKGPPELRICEAVLDIRKRSHLLIKGFRVQDSNWYGIGIFNCDHVTVQGCATASTQASGIYGRESTEIVIDGNDVTMACLYEGDKGGSQECISLDHVKGFRISNNQVHDTAGQKHGGEGIDAKGSAQDGVIEKNEVWNLPRLGIYVDCGDRLAKGIVVRKNIVRDCACGIVISSEEGGTVEDVRVENNLVTGNRERGIVVSAWVKNGPKRNIAIVNNTAVGNGNRKENWGAGIAVEKTDVTGMSSAWISRPAIFAVCIVPKSCSAWCFADGSISSIAPGGSVAS